MQHWIDEFTPLRVFAKEIPGATYNHIRVGLLRLGTPLYLPLERLPGLTCALDRRVWTVFDATGNGMPVLVWVGFARAEQSGLHLPVRCELRVYHQQAGLVMGRALDALEYAVDQQVRAAAHPARGTEDDAVGRIGGERDSIISMERSRE